MGVVVITDAHAPVAALGRGAGVVRGVAEVVLVGVTLPHEATITAAATMPTRMPPVRTIPCPSITPGGPLTVHDRARPRRGHRAPLSTADARRRRPDRRLRLQSPCGRPASQSQPEYNRPAVPLAACESVTGRQFATAAMVPPTVAPP
jgi:hypothetical protein